MASRISLKNLERGIFKTSFKDGTIDIQIGFFLLMFSLAPLLSVYLGDFWSSFVFLPIWIGVYFINRTIKRRLVQPRVGIVQYGSYRKRRLKQMGLAMLIFNLAALIIGILTFLNFSELPGWIFPVRFSVIILFGFSLAGYLLDLPRLYLYGILTSLAFPTGEFLSAMFQFSHHGLPVVFGILSSGIILTGVGLLLWIIHRLPDKSQEIGNA